MVNKIFLFFCLANLGIILGSSVSRAVPATLHQTYSSIILPTNKFQHIDQPLDNKVTITLGGLGLIGLEIWWFLLSKSKS